MHMMQVNSTYYIHVEIQTCKDISLCCKSEMILDHWTTSTRSMDRKPPTADAIKGFEVKC